MVFWKKKQERGGWVYFRTLSFEVTKSNYVSLYNFYFYQRWWCKEHHSIHWIPLYSY